MNTHYSLEEWTDYVRNLLSAERRDVMRAHEATCARCATDRRALDLVAATMQWDAALEVSPATRRVVYALASALPPAQPHPLTRLLAVLTLDSGTVPAAAGVRSGSSGVRQMVFQADPYQVHVQWEVAPSGAWVSLVGRITAVSAALPAHQAVRACTPHAVSAETRTNQFGEFVLECAWDPRLALLVPLADAGVELEVPLASVAARPANHRRPRSD